MILSIILSITSFCISIIGIIYIVLNREIYGTNFNTILNILLYIFFGLLFFPLFALSTEIFIEESTALLLYKFSIIFWIISTSMLSLIQSFIIKIKKISSFPCILYAFLGGIILSITTLSDSIEIFQGSNDIYFYRFRNLHLLLIIIFYNIMVLSLLLYNLFNNLSNVRDKKSGRNLALLTLQFSLIIFLYTIHLFSQNIIFKMLYLIFYLISATFVSYFIYNKPSLFIELTNRIYDFIIFQRSGILLYAYNFETKQETDDSLLKGSILIGINHILANFIDKKAQLKLIKMKDRDIIFEYDNSNGYGILLTTNHRNTFIEKAVKNFMVQFSDLNGETLKDMKGLIDVSEFKNAKGLILEIFRPYIIKH